MLELFSRHESSQSIQYIKWYIFTLPVLSCYLVLCIHVILLFFSLFLVFVFAFVFAKVEFNAYNMETRFRNRFLSQQYTFYGFCNNLPYIFPSCVTSLLEKIYLYMSVLAHINIYHRDKWQNSYSKHKIRVLLRTLVFVLWLFH